MNIKLLPIKNIELNTGMYVTDLKKIGNSFLVHDKEVDDNYWNYLYTEKLNESLIGEGKTFFHERNLPLSIYFLDDKDVKCTLEEKGFNLSYQDAIMVFEGPINRNDGNFEVKAVKSKNEEEDFIKIYKEVFCDKGAGVYSGLSGGYLNNIKGYFSKYPKGKRLDLVAHKDGEPMGITSVVFDDQYAAIMNVAVSEKYRRMGVANELTNECIKRFNGKIIFLSTEKESINEGIYRKLGFKTVVIGNCYKEKR